MDCPSGFSCDTDTDCPIGGFYQCSIHCCWDSNANNSCTDGQCVSDTDCKSGYHCPLGPGVTSACCEAGSSSSNSCTSDSDCTAPQFCDLGRCYCAICSDNSQCGEAGDGNPLYCNNGCCTE
jgi:hypothetical protein